MTALIIFTDLDGTLLDHESYEWGPATPAVDLCKERQAPVILVSSKTRAEMNPMRLQLGLASPFISENGGGIYFPKKGTLEPPPEAVPDEDLWKWALGPAYSDLVHALRAIRKELDLPLRGFSDMTLGDIADLTGLDLEKSRLAAMREYDEPFVLAHGGKSTLNHLHQAALRRGYQISRGGRFHHLHGALDKGDAVERLILQYKARDADMKTVALGDSPNDFSMLRKVDVPILLGAPGRFPELKAELSGLRLVEKAGPRGWNEAVLELFTKDNTKADPGKHV
jgi:mannosyl-3-phosphoglycerate phosphatase